LENTLPQHDLGANPPFFDLVGQVRPMRRLEPAWSLRSRSVSRSVALAPWREGPLASSRTSTPGATRNPARGA